MSSTDPSSTGEPRFVVATPARSVCDDNARALHRNGALRFIALATRRGIAGVPNEQTRLNPKIGLVAYLSAKAFSTSRAESFRFRLHPWFDRWVKKQLKPGNHVISSYGYANASFQWAREHGGKTFLEGGNSHPDNFWTILAEEHRLWKVAAPPIAQHHVERARAMMEHVDFVLSPSSFVTRSFVERGFKPAQILRNVYPVDLSCFKPPEAPRPVDRPLMLIAPGSLSLRKGTPYLLEAFRLVVKKFPTARLLLNRAVADNAMPVVEKCLNLPIDWWPALPHQRLAELMRTCDLLILPSLEDGFARTVTEGLACGLPVITTRNTGASDLIAPGQNGEIVPVRDPVAIAEAVFKWADRILSGNKPQIGLDPKSFSFEAFEAEFIGQLKGLGLI